LSKVIVISFDRWQAGFLGLYGNPWVDTPELDEFAVEAAVFDQHFAENLSGDAAQHAWWTGRYQFPLASEQQRREPVWLRHLTANQISAYLLYDPAASLPLNPREFTSARAVSLDDVPSLHFEEATPQFVKTAIQRIRKMGTQPDCAELLWVHAGGLPIDAPSLAYDELYGEDPPAEFSESEHQKLDEVEETPDGDAEESDAITEDTEGDDEDLTADSPRLSDEDFADSTTDQKDIQHAAEPLDAETIVFPPRFWRRARSSPRELADASLRGAGWSSRTIKPASATSASSDGDPQVDWQLRRDLYTAQVKQWDTWVGRIIKAARKLASSTPVMIVFTAAAGEHLGEHSELSESPRLFEESVHTPLMIQVPQTDPFAGRRLQLTTAADLPVTILDWFQVPVPETEFDGRSLLPVVQQDQPLARSLVLMGDKPIGGVRSADFYYRQNLDQNHEGEAVFVKPDDRWDVDNMLRQLPDAADSLRLQWQASANQIRDRSNSPHES